MALKNGGGPVRLAPAMVGVSNILCDVPEGWHSIAADNSRSMEEDRATRKFLYSNFPSRIEG